MRLPIDLLLCFFIGFDDYFQLWPRWWATRPLLGGMAFRWPAWRRISWFGLVVWWRGAALLPSLSGLDPAENWAPSSSAAVQFGSMGADCRGPTSVDAQSARRWRDFPWPLCKRNDSHRSIRRPIRSRAAGSSPPIIHRHLLSCLRFAMRYATIPSSLSSRQSM